jgi:hypothetical protein
LRVVTPSHIKYSLLFDSVHDLGISGVDFGHGYGNIADVAPSQCPGVLAFERTRARSTEEGVAAVTTKDVTFGRYLKQMQTFNGRY